MKPTTDTRFEVYHGIQIHEADDKYWWVDKSGRGRPDGSIERTRAQIDGMHTALEREQMRNERYSTLAVVRR